VPVERGVRNQPLFFPGFLAPAVWSGLFFGTPGMCPFSEVKVLYGPGDRDR
jgi:hypothetical protein